MFSWYILRVLIHVIWFCFDAQTIPSLGSGSLLQVNSCILLTESHLLFLVAQENSPRLFCVSLA